MDPRNDEPFDRRPWRALLGADTGAPTRDMDRRILAKSRSALTPRVARWWLPASLAASLLFAVLLVQRQLAVAPAPVSESDVMVAPLDAAAPAVEDAAPPVHEMTRPAQKENGQAAPAENVPPPMIDLPAMERSSAPVAEAPAASAPAPARQDAVLARERAPDAKSTADASAASPATPPPSSATVEEEPSRLSGNLSAKREYATAPRPAEEWYAEIRALRAAGHAKEADEELARFKTAYPGWLEKQQKKDP